MEYVMQLEHYLTLCCQYSINENSITAWLIYAMAKYHAVLSAYIVICFLILWFKHKTMSFRYILVLNTEDNSNGMIAANGRIISIIVIVGAQK
jgi:hypothetical protein